MITGFGAQADLFDLDLCLGFAGFAFLFLFVVKELAEVDDFDHWWISIWSDLNQVQTYFVGAVKSSLDGNNADVLTVFIHQANFFAADAFINAIILFTTNLLFSLLKPSVADE